MTWNFSRLFVYFSEMQFALVTNLKRFNEFLRKSFFTYQAHSIIAVDIRCYRVRNPLSN